MAVLAGAALAVLGSGCASNVSLPGEDGEPGVWELYDAESITPATSVLNLGVTRLDCSSGVTGNVLVPKVSYEPTRILIETDVEALHLDAAACPGNPPVRIRLELSEPIGERQLVDASCLNGDADHSSFCARPVRWESR